MNYTTFSRDIEVTLYITCNFYIILQFFTYDSGFRFFLFYSAEKSNLSILGFNYDLNDKIYCCSELYGKEIFIL